MEKMADQLRGLAEAYQQMADDTNIDDNDLYQCVACRDSGWIIVDNVARPCACQAAKQASAGTAASPGLKIPHLQQMTFANFDLQLYPEHLKTERGKSYRDLAREAQSEAMGFVNSLSRGQNRPGLIFEGEVGSGKTFLAAAIANQLIKNGIDTEFVVVPELLDTLRQNMNSYNEANNRLIERIKTVPVLVFDDMGAHNFSPWVQNVLFTTINHRLNYQLPLIITTNLNVEELYNAVGDRIASRLMESGPTIRMFIGEDIRLKLYAKGRYQW